jgi:Protein of unknown function (DUF1761)
LIHTKTNNMLNFQLPFPATLALSAIVPTIMGFIWYHPKVFGKAWMEASGLTEEKAKQGFNMPLVFGLSLVLSFMLSMSLMFATIHQFGFFSMMADPDTMKQLGDHNSAMYLHARAIFDACGTNFRTFRHGAFHGVILAVFTVVPVVGTNALFERKSFKYAAINAGFWIVCMGIMGAIICHFMPLTGIYPIKGF